MKPVEAHLQPPCGASMKGGIKWAVLIVSGVISLPVVLWVVFGSHEPVYEGKPLSYWLEEVNRAGRLDETEQASAAIRAMGTNCLPFLLRHIEHGPSPVKQSLAKFARKQSLVKFTFLESAPLVFPSVWAIRQLGADARPLTPSLIKLLEEPDRSKYAELGLWAIGPETIPALVAVCHSADERLRLTAALLMARVSVKDDGWAWGWKSATVSNGRRFHLTGITRDAVIDALRRNLRHQDSSVRRATAEALKKLDYKALRAAPELLAVLKDEVPTVREAAQEALKQISPDFDPKAEVK